MLEYRLVKKDYKILNILGKDNWILSCIDGEVMIFYKEIKKTKESKDISDTDEWLEFKNIYKNIKNSGLSNNGLKEKYNKLVKEGLHELIKTNLEEYIKYLEVKKKRDFALMASTYINQARYNDDWNIIEDMSKKFINDIYREKKLNADEIDNINTEISAYEIKHKREVTDGVVRNMIELLLNK